jgi:hypothetical protein
LELKSFDSYKPLLAIFSFCCLGWGWGSSDIVKKHNAGHERTLRRLAGVDQCSGIPLDHRDFCPLSNFVVVRDIQPSAKGLSIMLNAALLGGIPDVKSHINCQIAWGKSHGSLLASCPFHISGASSEISGDEITAVVTVEAQDEKTVTALHQLAERLIEALAADRARRTAK